MHLLVAIATAALAARTWWWFSPAQIWFPRILLGLTTAELALASAAVGSFNAVLKSQTSYVTANTAYTTGPGLSLMIFCVMCGLITMALIGIALLDLAGLPPSKWSAALRASTGEVDGYQAMGEGDTRSLQA